jgi:hypothetical protein
LKPDYTIEGLCNHLSLFDDDRHIRFAIRQTFFDNEAWLHNWRIIRQLKHDSTIISLLVSGFQDKGANWKDQQLYYFSIPTGIRYQGEADLFRVVYPDGTLSADYYNLARTKQHCRDLARAIYPRQSPAPSDLSDRDIAGASNCDVAGAPRRPAHSSKIKASTWGAPARENIVRGRPNARAKRAVK